MFEHWSRCSIRIYITLNLWTNAKMGFQYHYLFLKNKMSLTTYMRPNDLFQNNNNNNNKYVRK